MRKSGIYKMTLERLNTMFQQRKFTNKETSTKLRNHVLLCLGDQKTRSSVHMGRMKML
jgi:hypothetical protein